MSLVAQTNNDFLFATDSVIEAKQIKEKEVENDQATPEDFARNVCLKLLDEIYFVFTLINY